MADTQCLGEFEYGHNGGISLSALKTAQVLLAEAGGRFHLLLRQAAFAPKACKISTDKHSHVHVDCLPNTHYQRYLL